MKKILLSMAAVCLFAVSAFAAYPDSYTNPVITAMPSLTIAPDARAAGLGDIGVATDPDLNSQHWNAAKYAYMESHGGITANYTPWLRKLGVTDLDLAYLAGYYKWDDVQGVSMGFTYFSMGNVSITNADGTDMGVTARPYELALDASYYRKLHEYVSMAATLRFLYSDMNNGLNMSTGVVGATELKPAWTMAADIALFYKQPIDIPMGTSYFNLGFTLQNLGGKMTYDEMTSNFIPASMNIGATYELPFDKYNRLTFSLEANKMMVPTRKSRKTTAETGLNGMDFDKENSDTWTLSQDAYTKLTSVKGIFQSFGDAPFGAKEEFDEVRWGAGIEYSYNRQFFGRVGYSHENFIKGNRRYVTVGAGFHLSIFSLDFAYCIGVAPSNPLDQTMRFTLGFDLAGIKDLVNNRKN